MYFSSYSPGLLNHRNEGRSSKRRNRKFMQNFGDLLESDHLRRRPEGDWEYDTEVDNSNTGFLEVKI
jgi:hypothetical protein